METVDYRAVLGFIQDQAGSFVDIDSEKGRLKRLIHKAALDIKSPAYLISKGVEIEVHNGIAKMPCDLIRILRVQHPNGGKIDWNRQGGNEAIKVAILSGTIHLYYMAIPLTTIHDEDGEEQVIAILPEQIDYLGHYAISIYLREEWIAGRMPRDRFEYWDTILVPEARAKAKGGASLTSIDEMERLLFIMRNGQFIGRR